MPALLFLVAFLTAVSSFAPSRLCDVTTTPTPGIRVPTCPCSMITCLWFLGFCVALSGNHAVVVGTSRGVVAVIDLRFQLLVCAWRHSSRAAVTALFPYTTKSRAVAVLPAGSGGGATDSSPKVTPASPGVAGGGGSATAGSGSSSSGGVVRQLACGVACGEGDVSFWNLETGQPIRVLRVLPTEVAEVAALRAPFLTRIATKGECWAVLR